MASDSQPSRSASVSDALIAQRSCVIAVSFATIDLFFHGLSGWRPTFYASRLIHHMIIRSLLSFLVRTSESRQHVSRS